MPKLGNALLWGGASAGIFVLLVIALRRALRSCALHQIGTVARLGVHFAHGIIFIAAHTLLVHGLAHFFCGQCQSSAGFLNMGLVNHMMDNVYIDLLIYAAVLGEFYATAYYRTRWEGQQQADSLRAELQRAQLKSLTAQLNPHFLFNTLNAISALVYRDADMADRAIGQLSSFLRDALEKSEQLLIPLATELELLWSYLQIMQTRFQGQLLVEWEVSGEARPAEVPLLILQPLVENAILHGPSPGDQRRKVRIVAQKRAGYLTLQVLDCGPGFASLPRSESTGVGVSNTRQRLEQLYGGDFIFHVANREGGGGMVMIQIPFRLSPPTSTRK